MGILLKDVRRLDHSEPTTLRIADGRIDRIGMPDSTWPQGDEVLEGHGRLAFSGFVNAHTHLPMVLLRGLADDVPLSVWLEQHVWPLERQLTPEDVYWGTLLALAESLRNGVVAVADMYFDCDAIARAVEESGIRALLSYGMVAPSLTQGGSQELEKTRRFAASWHGAAEGRIAVAVSPHAVYTCGDDVWKESVALARELGLGLHTHVAETRAEAEACQTRTGLSPAAHLERLGAFAVPTLAAHCVHADEDDLRILARSGVSVGHCPKSNAKLGSGFAPVQAMRENGVRVAIGTDGAASNDRLDVLEELRFACLVARAQAEDAQSLSSRDAVRMATSDGRAALGLPQANVELGDPADVVLVDVNGVHASPPHDAYSTLAFASASADVTDVFVGGRPVLRNRRLVTVDEERVQSEIARVTRRLRQH